MKQILTIVFLLLTFFLNAKAQNSEIFGELIPYKDWLENEIEKNKGIDIFYSMPGKLNVKSFKIETNTLQNGESIAVIEVQTNSKDLIYYEKGGKLISKTRFWGRITSKDKKFDKVFEEILPVTIQNNQTNISFPVIFQRNYKLPKDKYTIKFLVNDTMSGWSAKKKIKFEIK